MRFAALLALIALIAVALKPCPSQAEAEGQPQPVTAEKIDARRKGTFEETTMSPKDFFLKHLKTTKSQMKHKDPPATVTGATTTVGPVKPKAKSNKGGKAKGKGARKNRAHCTQCSTTPVVTHMEKKANDEAQKIVNTTETLLDILTVSHHEPTAADAVQVVTNSPVNT